MTRETVVAQPFLPAVSPQAKTAASSGGRTEPKTSTGPRSRGRNMLGDSMLSLLPLREKVARNAGRMRGRADLSGLGHEHLLAVIVEVIIRRFGKTVDLPRRLSLSDPIALPHQLLESEPTQIIIRHTLRHHHLS